jgi:DNA-binding NarL/FixJ family response regulator
VDIKLSGTPGAQLLKTLKQFDPDVRVIALSAEDSTSLAKEMMDLGFYGFLKKPFVLSELGESLSTVIGN